MEIITFDPVKIGAIVALIASVVQLVKKLFERLEAWDGAPLWVRRISEWWAHSHGPVILAYAVSLFVVALPDIVQDGVLTAPELSDLLEIFGLSIGAQVLYWVSRWKMPKWLRK